MPTPELAGLLTEVLALLERTEPLRDEYDVAWRGPWFVRRPGRWHPTRFLLYGGALHCSLSVDRELYRLTWKIGEEAVEFARDGSAHLHFVNGEELWIAVLRQCRRKLEHALARPRAHAATVRRHLPLACRTAVIRRRDSWEAGLTSILPEPELRALEIGLQRATDLPPRAELSVAGFLDVAAVAHDAAFPEMAELAPVEKYRRRADGRHGGMLDLDPEDAAAFAEWYRSRDWAGAHPWEIVFGHPHGVMLAPCPDGARGGWTFVAWSGGESYHALTVTMMRAVLDAGAPLQLEKAEGILAALRGEDEVAVGPGFEQLSLEELLGRRSDAAARVRWDPIPELGPITEAQAARLEHVKRTGRPPPTRPQRAVLVLRTPCWRPP